MILSAKEKVRRRFWSEKDYWSFSEFFFWILDHRNGWCEFVKLHITDSDYIFFIFLLFYSHFLITFFSFFPYRVMYPNSFDKRIFPEYFQWLFYFLFWRHQLIQQGAENLMKLLIWLTISRWKEDVTLISRLNELTLSFQIGFSCMQSHSIKSPLFDIFSKEIKISGDDD